MKVGEFVIGIFHGTTEPYQTEQVEKLLSEDEFHELWTLDEPGIYTYTNPEERVIARSTVTQTSDGPFAGRKGVINHTVIVKYDATIEKDGCIYRFDPANITQQLADNLEVLNKPIPDPLVQPLPPP